MNTVVDDSLEDEIKEKEAKHKLKVSAERAERREKAVEKAE